MVLRVTLATGVMIWGLGAAVAGTSFDNKYNITPEEQAACQTDATLYCSAIYPDSDHLLSCMKANRSRLSPVCLKTFTAGLARRHL